MMWVYIALGLLTVAVIGLIIWVRYLYNVVEHHIDDIRTLYSRAHCTDRTLADHAEEFKAIQVAAKLKRGEITLDGTD